jgi:hypothetical protein
LPVEKRRISMNNPISLERPPKPPRDTARTRQALPLRVDAGLVRAFHETSKRLGVKPSEMMEIILWNALDRPPLSFEPEYLEQSASSQSE